jgi:uncharacterized iron-regulated membrane protein
VPNASPAELAVGQPGRKTVAEAMPAAGSGKMSLRPHLKQSMLRYHRWLGLIVGLFLLMQGLSGSLLVFRDKLEPAVHPELVLTETKQRASPEQLLDTVNSRFPDFAIARVEFPKRGDHAVIFKLNGRGIDAKRLVAVDPYRNEIVREGGIARWPFEWMLLWHEQLISGGAGETAIGIIGLALLFMVVSGLITWWPRGRLRLGFRITRGGGETTWRTAHRSIGALAAPVLLFSACTGSLMVFKDPLRDVLALVGPVAAKPSAKVADRPGTPLVSIDDLVARTHESIGPAALRQLRFADDGGRGVSVYVDATGDGIGAVTSFVAFDRYTGEELGRYVSGGLPRANAIVDFLYPLHTGSAGGSVMKAVLLMSAMVLVCLALSGPLLWLVRRRRLSGKRKAPAAPASPLERGPKRSPAQSGKS